MCPIDQIVNPSTGKCVSKVVIQPNSRCPPNYSFFDGYGNLCIPYLPVPADCMCPQGSQPVPNNPAYCFCPENPTFPAYPTKPLSRSF
jgi:hypothetical protein